MKMKSEREVTQSRPVRLLATPWTAAYQAPPSMGFSRQEYWSGVPLPSPSLNPNFTLVTGESNLIQAVFPGRDGGTVGVSSNLSGLMAKVPYLGVQITG